MFEHAGHSDAQGSPTSTELLARTLRYARRYVQWFALAAILAAITAVGRNARAYLLKPLLDEAIPQANLELFFWLGAAAAVIVGLLHSCALCRESGAVIPGKAASPRS